ncbi:Protein CBG11925 [Caenorhabditis briggsae]|nr:Protein CBG11925 [Caenorhabditis briggsae]UMM12557.1 hypothetical protein L5515_001274 [Caenorhabditis briggsae]CAP30986.2 Protein CBG11925 [Caenorhabditis briggsae]
MALTAHKFNRATFLPEGVMSNWFKLFDADRQGSGWYMYDPRTELVLEDCYKNKKNCEGDICRQKFPINIEKRTPIRGERHLKKRCIQRIEAEDIYRYDVKGIAGMRCHFFPITNRMLT